MPYIEEEYRKDLESDLKRIRTGLTWFRDKGPGFLNYAITKILVTWLGPNPNYAKYNEVIGALECVKLELYRRQVAAYEEGKCLVNGDVYEDK